MKQPTAKRTHPNTTTRFRDNPSWRGGWYSLSKSRCSTKLICKLLLILLLTTLGIFAFDVSTTNAKEERSPALWQSGYDLALSKHFLSATTLPDGTIDLAFAIKIHNQGTLTTTAVMIVDYIPSGFALSSNDSNGWATNGVTATLTLDGPFAPIDPNDPPPLASIPGVEIVLNAPVTLAPNGYQNGAEIVSFQSENGLPQSDDDSTGDMINGNDPQEEDVVNESQTDDVNQSGVGDEDDHDVASFALAETVSLGNLLWDDRNNNGLYDAATEVGLDRVEVRLYRDSDNDGTPDGGTIQTQFTNDDGYYLFADLTPDTYIVEVVPPTGYRSSSGINNGAEPAPDADLSDADSDDNGTTLGAVIRSAPVTLSLGDEPTGEPLIPTLPDSTFDASANYTLDFGLFQSATVDGRLWKDRNGDGKQGDPVAEPGIQNVTVGLYDATTAQPVELSIGVPMTTTTAANGSYLFADLIPGNYYVVFDVGMLPTTYQATVQNVEGNAFDAIDSDANASGQSIATGLLAGGESGTLDMGVVAPVVVGDRVWYDNNGDGLQGDPSDEPGVLNVRVTLFDAATDQPVAADIDGQPVSALQTDADGLYAFTNLAPGSYYVTFDYTTLPAGYKPAPKGVGNDDALDSDADPQTGVTAPSGPLPAGADFRDLDLGVVGTVQVGDRVWYDTDKDGLQGDPLAEPGAQGIHVALFGAESGTQVTVDADGNIVLPQATDIDGNYTFTNLVPGAYYVRFDLSDLPPGYVVTTPNVNNNGADADDSDAAPSTGETASSGFLRAGVRDLKLDMGIVLLDGVRVGDRVWNDLNMNGLQDDGEPGVPNVSVTLYDNTTGQPASQDKNGDPIPTKLTDETGSYLFEDLLPGDYYVRFDLSTIPDAAIVTALDAGDDARDSDAEPDPDSPNAGKTAATGPLVDGDEVLSLDMGIVFPVSVGDRAWFDNDGDGVQGDPIDEPALPDLSVRLYDAATDQPITTDLKGNPVTAQRTDADGRYHFANLRPGNFYTVFELADLPDGYRPTTPQAGNDNAEDSDVDLSGRSTETGFLDGGATYVDLDLGVVAPVAVGDHVWFDNNGDGLQGDPAVEPGVGGILVRIFDATTDQQLIQDLDGNSIGTLETNDSGNYLFQNLPPGDYYVIFDLASLPAGYFATHQRAGNDSALDSSADPQSGKTVPSGFLSAGERFHDLDMGLVGTVRVGGRVWQDADRNGLQGAPEIEAGVPNITVTLYSTATQQPVDVDVAGVAITPQKTTTQGSYLFENLPPGGYYVRFDVDDLPAGFVVTAPNSGENDEIDSDASPSTGESAPTGFMAVGAESLHMDMGIYELEGVRVGDFVWHDLNNNGLQESGEPGVPNIGVTLYNSATDEQVLVDIDGVAVPKQETDENGFYLFDRLPDGDYYVVFDLSDLPKGARPSAPDAGDTERDSDADPVSGRTGSTGPLVDGDEALSLDLGIWRTVQIGDRAWYDNDGDGVQDGLAIEPGVAGISVTLYSAATGETVTVDADGKAIRVQQTDESGKYRFENLLPGGYLVHFDLSTLPNGYRPTTPNAGNDDTEDSDADGSGVVASTGFLASGREDLSLDLGIVAPVQIGDFVWYDDNQNGLQDENEAGVAGVGVALFNAIDNEPVVEDIEGNALPEVKTNELGFYKFTNLAPGNYYIVFDLSTIPAQYQVSAPDAGDDERDSDANTETGRTISTGFLTANSVALQMDMGVFRPAVSVGDYVWIDRDYDGLQDVNEEGVSGVRVNLFDASLGQQVTVDIEGNPIKPQVTNADGIYRFEDLPPGQYYVVFDLSTVPEGYRVTRQNAADSAANSDANPATGRSTNTEELAVGSKDFTLDMGLVPTVSVGDLVWYDANKNGIQESVETGVVGKPIQVGVPGVEVTLYGDDDFQLMQQITGPDGAYRFDHLYPGKYVIGFRFPDGYTLSPQDQGLEEYFDSDADGATLRSPEFELRPGEQNVSVDMGIFLKDTAPATIGDFVWYDEDRDGLQDLTEVGLGGVTVALYRGDDQLVARTSSDSRGHYEFSNLVHGTYYLEFTPPAGYKASPQNEPSNDEADSDANPTNGRTALTTLRSGQVDRSWDAGFYTEKSPVALGDLVFYDTNGNGLHDISEAGIPGVLVTLYNAERKVVEQMRTGTDGRYHFINLPPGGYYVGFDPPDGFQLTSLGATAATVRTAAFGPQTDVTSLIALAPGAVDLTRDIGFVLPDQKPATLGNRVWEDFSPDGTANGVQDLGEPNVAGVVVKLHRASGGLVATTVTNNRGRYLFSNLVPGEYYLEFVPPDEYLIAKADYDLDDDFDNNADPDTGRTGVIQLGSGEEDLTWDMGIFSNRAVPGAPTTVVLTSFTAKPQKDGVLVRWTTSAEIDTFGFHIYQGASGDFLGATKMNQTLIASHGPQGGTYELLLPYSSLPALDKLTIWLVETEVNGRRNQYGPIGLSYPPKETIYLPLVVR